MSNARVVDGYELGPNRDLRGIKLIGLDLRSVDLSGSNLTGATIDMTDLEDANLSKSILNWATIDRVNFGGANLSNVDLSEARVSYSDLTNAFLDNANLNEAQLTFTRAKYSKFTHANLCGAMLSAVDLSFADLASACLTFTELSSVDLGNSDLTGVNIVGAQFDLAWLSNSQIANLRFFNDEAVTGYSDWLESIESPMASSLKTKIENLLNPLVYLDEIHRRVIEMRFGIASDSRPLSKEDYLSVLSKEEVAEDLGISLRAVERIEAKALYAINFPESVHRRAWQDDGVRQDELIWGFHLDD